MARHDIQCSSRPVMGGPAMGTMLMMLAMPDMAFAYLKTSAIAKGRIKTIDVREAKALPGVLDILTHENMRDAVRETKFFSDGGYASNSKMPLNSPDIAYGGQTIAVVGPTGSGKSTLVTLLVPIVVAR